MILTSGCFEIIEEVTMNNDGSGSMKYTLNLSRSKFVIKSNLAKDTVNNYEVPSIETLKNQIANIEKQLSNQQGISNVSVDENWQSYIFVTSLDFQNTESLNAAINAINTAMNQNTNYEPIIEDNFIYQSGEFTRLYGYDLLPDFESLKMADKVIFNEANYTCIYRFADEVDETTNKRAVISKNNKNVFLKTKLLDVITNKKTIKNTITLSQ